MADYRGRKLGTGLHRWAGADVSLRIATGGGDGVETEGEGGEGTEEEGSSTKIATGKETGQGDREV